jgi:anti-sigma factor RsiW
MSREERERRDLHAWHDGELSWLGRRRVRRRLARDPAARREVEALDRLGSWLRREDPASAATPGDLWSAIREQLPAAAPARKAADPRSVMRRPAWVTTGVALVAAVVALAILGPWGHAPTSRSVRWMRFDGQGAVLLEDDRKATIIWVLGEPDQVSISGRADGKLT